MYSIDNPAEMTQDERFLEVAWILAKGFSRLRKLGIFSTSVDSSIPDISDHAQSGIVSERLDNAGITATELDISNPLSHCSDRDNRTKSHDKEKNFGGSL
ncbi:MAG: hypothetical protein P9X24_04870 [Candidatus Hatepunaea meridiana]|nr:hypothetical protein [Candidatus Hatepunaea meridiana]